MKQVSLKCLWILLSLSTSISGLSSSYTASGEEKPKSPEAVYDDDSPDIDVGNDKRIRRHFNETCFIITIHNRLHTWTFLSNQNLGYECFHGYMRTVKSKLGWGLRKIKLGSRCRRKLKCRQGLSQMDWNQRALIRGVSVSLSLAYNIHIKAAYRWDKTRHGFSIE